MIVQTVTNGNKKLDIIKDGDKYYFDYNGDWYDENWCENPLQQCINDAKEELKPTEKKVKRKSCSCIVANGLYMIY